MNLKLCVCLTIGLGVILICLLSFYILITSSYKEKNKLLSFNKNKSCLVSQFGYDGFGHQTEGKLSCLLSEWLINNITYYHQKYESFAHVPGLSVEEQHSLESFINIGSVAKPLAAMHDLSPISGSEIPTICHADSVYVIDNCFNILYSQGDAYKNLGTPAIINRLRAFYFASPKPKVFNVMGGSDTSDYFRIAMHIRGGDAGNRILPFNYYKKSVYASLEVMRQSIIKYNVAFIWVSKEDEIGVSYLKLLQEEFSNYDDVKVIFHLPTIDEFTRIGMQAEIFSLELSFHHFVEADIFISSFSSFSYAAALFRNNFTVIPSRFSSERENWFSTDTRFIRINGDGIREYFLIFCEDVYNFFNRLFFVK